MIVSDVLVDTICIRRAGDCIFSKRFLSWSAVGDRRTKAFFCETFLVMESCWRFTNKSGVTREQLLHRVMKIFSFSIRQQKSVDHVIETYFLILPRGVANLKQ